MEQFFKLTVTFHIIMRLTFLCNTQRISNVAGQLDDYTDFSLEEEIASVQRQRRSDNACLWRSVEVKISWLHAAPFVYQNSCTSRTERHNPIVTGIFHDIVKNAIGFCCNKFSDSSIPPIRYLQRAKNLNALQEVLFRGGANMIIPVHSDERVYGGDRFPFVKILDSPGVVLIQRRSSIYHWKLVLKALLGTWPVVIMAILLSCVAGVVIWILDLSHNTEQFSRTFHRGVFQGFYWAFVTIATVGYGDKVPKSTIARSFAVLWITIGVALCAVMTAVLSSALTTTESEKYDFTNKWTGVLKDSVAFEDAINLAGANLRTFKDPDEMYDALENDNGIDGILEEFFIGTESVRMRNMSQKLSVIKFFGHKRPFGVAYWLNLFANENIADCFSHVIKIRHNEVLKTTINYTRATRAGSEQNAFKVFDSQSPVFVACAVGLSIIVLVCLAAGRLASFLTTKRPKSQQERSDLATDPEIDLEEITE